MAARAVVGTVVAVVVVGAGLVVADVVSRAVAEQDAERAVMRELDVDGTPDVRIEGFPFLTQLASRTLDDVTATASGVTLDGVRLTDVTATGRDVSLEAPNVVAEVRIEATVPVETVSRLVADRTGLTVDLTVDGGSLRASGDLLGAELSAGLVPRVEGGRLLVEVEDLVLGTRELRVEDLPEGIGARLAQIEVPVEGLPEGTTLEAARVVPDGVRVTATGTDVALRQARQ